MNLGAIAVLDVLGFKGIWNREDSRVVIRRMKELRRLCLGLRGEDGAGALMEEDYFRHRIRWMSDTLVVTVVLRDRNPPRRPLYKAACAAALIAGAVIEDALRGRPPLLLRGCIAVGGLVEDASTLIGPAVDEAASLFKRPDGPFLVLAPSAMQIAAEFADTYGERLVPNLMLPYRVPLNDGSRMLTPTYRFGCAFGDAKTRRRKARLLAGAFGCRPLSAAVRRKRTNAARFLRFVDRETKRRTWLKHGARPLRRPRWQDLTTGQRIALIRRGIVWDDAFTT